MEAQFKRKIDTSKQYDKYFGTAEMLTTIVEEDANLTDTITEIKRMVKQYYPQTTKISKILDKKDVYKTCEAIWQFVYHNIQYKLDEDGKEQLRTPNRTWKDRFNGVDCDCYSLFISSILYNLGIRHKFRLAEYQNKGYFQHIYIVVPCQNKEIILDCVKDNFNQEHNYTKKKDIEMTLEKLSGFDMKPVNENGEAVILSNSEEQDAYIKNVENLVKGLNLNEINALKLVFKQEEFDKFNLNDFDYIDSNDLRNWQSYLSSVDAKLDTDTMVNIFTNLDISEPKIEKYIEQAKILAKTPTKKKFSLLEFWQKNSFEIIVFGGAALLTVATIISFLPSSTPPPKPQTTSGLSGTTKKRKKKKSKKTADLK